MPDETHTLTKAMAAGDGKAVEAFYRRYFDWLYAQARRATRRDEAFCLDVVQESVLRIIRTVRAVEGEGRFRAWLKLVVQTTALDLMRSEKRRASREMVAVMVGPGQATVEAAESGDIEWLRNEIARLDPQIVRLIELRYERRWTLARISRALGLSIGTIDGRLRRAIGHLRRTASEELDDG